MKGQRHSTVWILLLIVCTLGVPSLARDGNAQGSPTTEREVLEKFQASIDAYMALHDRLEKESRLRGRADSPEQLHASQQALASKILAERKNPRQGDIFTEDVRTVFRGRLRRELQGPKAAELKKTMEGPTRMLLRVHAEYPVGWPLASMPPSLLAVLPKLPEDLEYRFVGTTMILRDVHANLIIDYFTKAIR